MIVPQENTNMMINGDSLLVMKELPENSVDAVVTDPPYGLSFMGKKWDYDVPSVDLWKEVLRVLKPGGYLLSFAGTRTYHRMAVNIEDAGFDIRDMISWLYGSGFPKSLNIGKQVDKIQGNEREVVGLKQRPDGSNPRINVKVKTAHFGNSDSNDQKDTKGNSEWEGWGTALKPACEPIVVARKPLSEKNVALNVLKWGTGGINIDGCRVGKEDITTHSRGINTAFPKRVTEKTVEESGRKQRQDLDLGEARQGRFPANIILDEEAGSLLDQQSGVTNGDKIQKKLGGKINKTLYDGGWDCEDSPNYSDKGGASRFFYCAKASKSERNLGCEELEEVEIKGDVSIRQNGVHGQTGKPNKPLMSKNNHPTVKPIKLMEYLVKLVSKEGATVLDPFLGSGTTAIACEKLGRKWIGIEKDADYVKIANARIKKCVDPKQDATTQNHGSTSGGKNV